MTYRIALITSIYTHIHVRTQAVQTQSLPRTCSDLRVVASGELVTRVCSTRALVLVHARGICRRLIVANSARTLKGSRNISAHSPGVGTGLVGALVPVITDRSVAQRVEARQTGAREAAFRIVTHGVLGAVVTALFALVGICSWYALSCVSCCGTTSASVQHACARAHVACVYQQARNAFVAPSHMPR
jgi:hypothetical protein